MSLLSGADVDREYLWPDGRAERLARRGKLPHIVLPDGSIRFERETLDQLVLRIPATPNREAVPC